MQNFPSRLEAAIERSGRSKGALAAHVGVALSTVSRWLGGSMPKAEALGQIADFLGVDAKWLMTGREGPHQYQFGERPESMMVQDAVGETQEERIQRLERSMAQMSAEITRLVRALDERRDK